MSYPEPRYLGEGGEASAVLRPGAPREPYFEHVAEAATWTEEERTRFFLEHDTFWR